MIQSTHTVYVMTGHRGRLAQVNQPTSIYYEIDAKHPIQENSSEWYPITKAAPGRAWDLLFVQVPHGAQDGIVLDDLGARMKLIKNRWYVDAKHISLDQAFPPSKTPIRLTCLQVVAVGVLVGGAIGIVVWDIAPTVYVGVIVVTFLIMVADRIIQRIGGR